MTSKQMEHEQNYRVAMAVAIELLQDGVIDEVELCEIDTIMQAKFRPIIAGLYPKTT